MKLMNWKKKSIKIFKTEQMKRQMLYYKRRKNYWQFTNFHLSAFITLVVNLL